MVVEAPQFTAGTWPIFGHGWAVDLLQQAIAPAAKTGGRRDAGPSHAYLLLGAPQLGKTTLARAFAQALLCTAEAARPCNRCRSCVQLQHGNHPDFRLLQPRDKEGRTDRVNGELRAEQANELIREAALRPLEGRYRVFLIQDVHTANPSFANKILKTLEEPPAQVVLLLTAADRQQVLPTIISRCQVLELRPLDRETVAHALRAGWHADEQQADLLARLSNGRLGWAVAELAHPEHGAERAAQIDTLLGLLRADPIDRLALAESLAAKRDSRQLFGLIETWTSWWRDVMLVQADARQACSNVDRWDQLAACAAQVEQTRVREFLAVLQRIEGYLHHTVNTRLALDVLVLRLPQMT